MLKIESLEQPCKIIDVVLKTVKDVCPNIVVVESLINPLEVVRYHSSVLTFFRVKHLAVAVSSHKEAVESVHRNKTSSPCSLSYTLVWTSTLYSVYSGVPLWRPLYSQ